MFKKYLALFILIFFAQISYAEGTFDSPTTAREVAEKLPQLNSVTCKFTQEKTIRNKTLKSGGNFKFIKDKGVIFETLYPVKSTSTYTSDSNKQISGIITGIANKDYSYINKNFNLYYTSNDQEWTLVLKPKEKSPAYGQLESILISGRNDIHKINIKTTNGIITNINFSCGI